MADKVSFELVSPERLLVSEDADMVVLPAEDGDMGVLAGHSPVITTVRPGTICMYEGDKVVKRLFVAGGFAEVTDERCTVLADDAEEISSIDKDAVRASIKDLGEDVSHAKGDAERAAAETALAVAEAKLRAAEHPAYS